MIVFRKVFAIAKRQLACPKEGVQLLSGSVNLFHHSTTSIKNAQNQGVLRTDFSLVKRYGSHFEDGGHWSVQDVVEWWCKTFEYYDVSEPHQFTQLIVAHVLGKKMIHEVNNSQTVSSDDLKTVGQLCRRRLERLPVQYIIGEWDFRDLTLVMRPPVFIPRPETEELVGLVYEDVKSKNIQSPKILEIGCGSGAIGLALLKMLPQASVLAIDQSSTAVQLTVENAIKNDLADRITAHNLSLCTETLGEPFLQQKFDVVVSNPPYIPSGDMNSLAEEILRYEDHAALCGGNDGLDVVKHIIELASQCLLQHGSLWLEVDSTHPVMIDSYIKTAYNNTLSYTKTYSDFNGLSRFCHVHRTETEPM